MIPIAKTGDSFYFSNDKSKIYICVGYVYRPLSNVIKTYKAALQGKLYPIYICAKTMEEAIIINQTKHHATHTI